LCVRQRRFFGPGTKTLIYVAGAIASIIPAGAVTKTTAGISMLGLLLEPYILALGVFHLFSIETRSSGIDREKVVLIDLDESARLLRRPSTRSTYPGRLGLFCARPLVAPHPTPQRAIHAGWAYLLSRWSSPGNCWQGRHGRNTAHTAHQPVSQAPNNPSSFLQRLARAAVSTPSGHTESLRGFSALNLGPPRHYDASRSSED
jgi:hypothetical protein